MEEEKNSKLFLSLIYSLQYQCMIQLGKMANPMTGNSERDLEAAQVTIDMLDMLKSKTKNGLLEHETKFFDQVLADLKLNYVDESQKPSATVTDSSEDSKPEPAQEVRDQESNISNEQDKEGSTKKEEGN